MKVQSLAPEKLFRACGVNLPDGYEDLHTKEDVINALAKLKEKIPALRKTVVKINDGFSGDGNAIYSLCKYCG